jgi:Alginate lyase
MKTIPHKASVAFALAVIAAAANAGLGALVRPSAGSAQWCVSKVSEPVTVIDEIFPEVIHRTPGRDRGAEQLFRPIRSVGKPLGELGSACLAGQSEPCKQFAAWVDALARADALRFDRERHKPVPVSFVTGTLSGNLTLRPIALYTGVLLERGQIELADRARVMRWLRQRALDYEHAPRVGADRLAQNLVLNSALTQQAVGIVVGDAALTARAASLYRAYMDTMRADGSFPEETKRGTSALKYTNMALGALVQAAEMAPISGDDFYGYRSRSGDLHRAVEFLLDALDDETRVEGYAAAAVAPTDAPRPDGRQARGFLKTQMGWVQPYIARFPRLETSRRLRKLVLDSGAGRSVQFDEGLGAVPSCLWGPVEER